MAFTQAEIDYLTSQLLGRIATVAPDGTPQVRPTSFHYNAELGTIDVGGYHMADTQKYRNVAAGSAASIVVDDLASVDPWLARGIEVRGTSTVVSGQEPYMAGFDGTVIRIHPTRILSWGLEPDREGMNARAVSRA